MKLIKTTSLIAAALFTLAGVNAATITVPEGKKNFHLIEEDTTWTSDNVYVLNTFVIVPEGVTLTIEPGTVVLGDTDIVDGKVVGRSAEDGVALIVAQGGTLIANGTPEEPIIFSAVGGTGDPDAGTIADPIQVRGLWGGVIMLGNAIINSNGQDGNAGGPGTVAEIEGVPSSVPLEYRTYGGDDNSDSSGSLRFVSIRHSGAILGAGNEIQGLSAGGVGSGTTIEFLEIFATNDDGVEFFGGTANVKYLIIAGTRDDGLDTDQGYNGNIQFVLVYDVLGDDGQVGRGGEHDGGQGAETAEPFSLPIISNATMIGIGANRNPDLLTNDENNGLRIRDNSGVSYKNSYFTEYNNAAIRIDEDTNFTEDSRKRLEAGDINFQSNYFVADRFGAVVRNEEDTVIAALSDGDSWTETIFTTASKNNVLGDIALVSLSRAQDNKLDPRIDLASGSTLPPAFVTPSGDPFFTEVDFIGAFDPEVTGGSWAHDWTALDELNFLVAGDFIAPDVESSDTFFLGDPDTTQVGNSQTYNTDLGLISIAQAPFLYNPELGTMFSLESNNLNDAWFYYFVEELATWGYVSMVFADEQGYWVYFIDGGESTQIVKGWAYVAMQLSEEDESFVFIFDTEENKFESFEDDDN